MIVVDGPLGTELAARGVGLAPPLWTGSAVRDAGRVVGDVHRMWADVGATLHRAGTFRTGPHHAGTASMELTARAVALCRGAVPDGHRVFGSVGPLGDCYRPWETPDDPRPAHRMHVRALWASGVDGLIAETFAHPEEARVVTEEAARTGLDVWTSLTAGPDGSLLTPREVGEIARRVRDAGASVVLLNCTAIDRCEPYLEVLASQGLWGCLPNAGAQGGPYGWDAPGAAEACRPFVERWAGAGAAALGGCCGTGPGLVRSIRELAEPLTPARPPP